jgi:elongator complex protein 3
VSSKPRTSLIRNDALLERYRSEIATGLRRPNTRLERILTLNGIRSQSGIATVTVITEPYPCPGRCVYCPTEARAPKSYLTNEPAMMRAVRNDYDPYRQVTSRMDTLHQTGHATDKIELIIKGGTWSFYPEAYQQEFIQRCLDAANGIEAESLEDAQRRNETAAHRIIGLTIETRPDYINESEIRRLRELGVTRVELGVQSLNERVLELIVREHTTAEVRGATALLRNAGFKIAYHLMPNLPGATPEDDRETFHELFENPAYRPDAMKIYPCVVIESAELSRWWKEGRYQPYDDETLIELLADVKALVPPYVRIERVIRDIPSTSIVAGCKVTNLRETVLRRMAQQGRRCRCIRCRQVRDQASGSFELRRRDYEANDGREVFLSFEEPSTDKLAAFLRLRLLRVNARGLPGAADHWWGVLSGAALIRELHTYGRHLSLHDRRDDAVQHRGFGRQLLAEAERIARDEFGFTRMAVIAGIGVREYYRRFGYALEETYMTKDISRKACVMFNA